ncbi:nucleoside hydrolase [Panus rudis PR-1116 ss-1]|nr:nucleoside hydrolase [Panus rudis PR-1116 ss-1]
MSRTPVIIDTDPGVDDVLALLLALASPELEVLAIIVSYGNTDADASYLNVLKIYEILRRHLAKYPEEKKYWPNFAQQRKTVLARGANGPLQGELHSAQYFHGRDGLGDITNRFPSLNLPKEVIQATVHPQLELTDRPGVDVALDLINTYPSRNVTYIALGPLTTLAQIVTKGGNIFNERIGKIICMGGALDVPGNTSPVAEFNFYADPFAVHDLLTHPPHAPLPIPLERFLLLPLDITTPHELPFAYYVKHIDSSLPKTATSESDHTNQTTSTSLVTYFTSAFLSRTREVMIKFGKDAMELHDITAVWCAIANPPSQSTLTEGWETTRRTFQVERIGELTRGMLVVDRRNDVGAYAPGSNRAKVQAELERLDIHPQGLLESSAVPAQVDVEEESQAEPPVPQNSGVPVITRTPGSEALLQLLAKRVWGVGRA